MRHQWILSGALLSLAACGTGPSSSASNTGSDLSDDIEVSLRSHLLPVHASQVMPEVEVAEVIAPADLPAVKDDAAPQNTASGPHLKYFGGPVISKVNVIAVYWGSGVKETSTIQSFFPA